MQLINDLIAFLANPPGNLVYILAVSFTLIGSLQGAINQWRASGYPQARRMVFGLVLLVVIQLSLFVVSGLMEQNIIHGLAMLPVLDRGGMLISLIWVIWIWAFPEPSNYGDAATALLSLLVIAATIFGCVAYLEGNPSAGSFNISAQSFYWSLGGAVLLFLGLVLILLRRPENWGTGLAVILLAMVGFVLDMFFLSPRGDYSGIVRFFMLAAYPLLLTLPMRFPTAGSGAPPRTVAVFQKKVSDQRQASEEQHSQAVRERRRYSTDPKTLQSLLALAAEDDPNKTNQFIARSVAQAMLADLCFLIYLSEDKNSLFIATGYDLIREENLDGGIINKDSVPMLANAVLRGRPLRLPASTTSSDLKGLSDLLGLPNPGNLLNVPISSEKGTYGSIMLLSPYSNRVWSADDQTFLISISSAFVPIIERGRHFSELNQQHELIQRGVDEADVQSKHLQELNSELNTQIAALKVQLEQSQASAGAQKEQVDQVSRLEKEIEELRSRPESAKSEMPISQNSQIEAQLRMTLEEMARLQNTLAQSNMKIMELENRPSGKLTSDQAEVIVSISQELRQPMSSIIGYADLLLGESVGILGALQRKFIERVRASTERIGSLIDDLIQITSLETGLMALKPESVDLNLIIDNAMAYTSSQMREKNISLRIDIPDNLRPLHADREAMQQILIHLLQNAGAASPVEGSITLRVRTQKEGGADHVIIQVSDTGGGIPKEDLARVFSRLYRAENVLIQGVGDTGVGLSIAKTLTEAQSGRIWVETEMGTGSTFSVALPLKSNPAEVPQEA
jgi:signal transduction histidine kinase